MKIFRHGDLLLKEVKALPKGLKLKKDNILALGEVTGHHHKLMPTKQDFADSLKTYLDELTGNVFFSTQTEVKLTHQEHKTLTIEKGHYEVIIEREYDPFTKNISQVID